jgi:LysM repeat protein
MTSYHKTIKGKKYDGELLKIAESSVSGVGDGRISLGDAKKILYAVKDSNTYSEIEKHTMSYIRDHYKFTPEADKWFRTEIRKWASSKSSSDGKRSSGKKHAQKTGSISKSDRVGNSPEKGYHTSEEYPDARKSGTLKALVIIFMMSILFALILAFAPKIRAIFVKDTPAIPAIAPEVTVVAKKTPGPEKKIQPADESKYYIVKDGDTLTGISKILYGDSLKWERIYKNNSDIIKDPSLIYAGQKLKLSDSK